MPKVNETTPKTPKQRARKLDNVMRSYPNIEATITAQTGIV